MSHFGQEHPHGIVRFSPQGGGNQIPREIDRVRERERERERGRERGREREKEREINY